MNPSRGEVWQADLDPVRGHEQGGARPVLIISEDIFNHSTADLVVAVPITSKYKGFLRSHVIVHPPEGRLRMSSYIKCEDVRSLSKLRLIRMLGSCQAATLKMVEHHLRVLMGL